MCFNIKKRVKNIEKSNQLELLHNAHTLEAILVKKLSFSGLASVNVHRILSRVMVTRVE